MKEIYKRRYVNDSVAEEDILFSSKSEDEINEFLNDFVERNNYIKFGKIWVNQDDNNLVILLGNEEGLI